jgi:hypothetical protein
MNFRSSWFAIDSLTPRILKMDAFSMTYYGHADQIQRVRAVSNSSAAGSEGMIKSCPAEVPE